MGILHLPLWHHAGFTTYKKEKLGGNVTGGMIRRFEEVYRDLRWVNPSFGCGCRPASRPSVYPTRT
jgi:hypothetical protein